MPQGEERPEQRESDLFSALLVDNCQFKSLMFIFIADYSQQPFLDYLLAESHPLKRIQEQQI